MFGAYTRLSDSGLGCPDWPGCYASASPLAAHGPIAAAQADAPAGPVTLRKAWIEMTHRYLATAVGALIAGLAVASWWLRRRGRTPVSPWWPTATLAWVVVQGAFGAWTVTWKLYPLVVTAHLLGALGLIALLAGQREAGRHDRAVLSLPPGLQRAAWLLALRQPGADRPRRLGQYQLRRARLPANFRPARAASGRPWITPRRSSRCANSGVGSMAPPCRSRP